MIVIADSGSTSTDWRIYDGKEILSFHSIGMNPFFITADRIVEELQTGELSGFVNDIDEVFFYGTGVANESMKAQMQNAFERVFTTAGSIHIEDDLLAASRALFKSGSGIACILGTGSNSCLYREGSIVDRVPALGYILGDEGSGARLGISLINALLKRQLSEELSRKLIEEEGLSMGEVLENVYRKEFPNRYLASLTRILHANLEYPEMRNLVYGSFEDFYLKNISRYEGHLDLEIGFAGSIAWHFKELLDEVLKSHGLSAIKIIQAPIDELVRFHTGS